MNDSIVISGIKATGYHGVFEHERRDGQEFLVDVTLTLDLQPASISDDLSETIDYGVVAKKVVQHIQGEPVALIEKLAGLIADDLLSSDLRLLDVVVTVHKPSAPVEVRVADIAVTVHRSR